MNVAQNLTRIISVAAILGMLATSAVAGQYGNRSGDRDGSQSRDRTKDNSCVLNTTTDTGTYLLAKQNRKKSGGQNGTQSRKRSKDGSCLSA